MAISYTDEMGLELLSNSSNPDEAYNGAMAIINAPKNPFTIEDHLYCRLI